MSTSSSIRSDGPKHPTEITAWQANLLNGPNFGCMHPMTNYHNLDCGHAVLTSTDWPSDESPKSACASNCARNYNVTENKRSQPTLVPFVCATCIEVSVKRNYVKVWKEFHDAGFMPAFDYNTNIGTWTYCSVRAQQEVGMRVAQGAIGVYLLAHEHEYSHINFVPSVVGETLKSWTFESRQTTRDRSRSQSPRRDDEEKEGLSRARNDYRDRSAPKTYDFVMDELAGRLEDAKVGLVSDQDVDDLLAGVGSIQTLGLSSDTLPGGPEDVASA